MIFWAGRGAGVCEAARRRHQMAVFLFANNKGGVGKSTLSTNFAAALALADPEREVLYVDLTFTKSTSQMLLGDAPPRSFAGLLAEFYKSKRTRDGVLWSVALAFVAAAVAMQLSGPRTGAAVVLAFVAYLYYMVKCVLFRRVDPSRHAAQSSLAPNLKVLSGGESLARFANAPFPWQMALKEWHVANRATRVVIDIDNVLDDFARFGLALASRVIVPMTLSPMDFERLCVDPRNGSLFEFARAAGALGRVAHVAVNRLRCSSNARGEDGRFSVSAADAEAAQALQRRFEGKAGHAVQLSFVREMPPSVTSHMHGASLPVVFMKAGAKTVPEAQLDGVRGDMEALVRDALA